MNRIFQNICTLSNTKIDKKPRTVMTRHAIMIVIIPLMPLVYVAAMTSSDASLIVSSSCRFLDALKLLM